MGSVEGGFYSHRAAHFEWLLDVGTPLGLDFSDLGKRQHGTAATLYFCDKLYEIYGSDDPSLALGASFAIEHWANGGFWDRLLSGFEELNRSGRLPAKTPLGFWRFHSVLEAQHASHTMDELEEQKKKYLHTRTLSPSGRPSPPPHTLLPPPPPSRTQPQLHTAPEPPLHLSTTSSPSDHPLLPATPPPTPTA